MNAVIKQGNEKQMVKKFFICVFSALCSLTLLAAEADDIRQIVSSFWKEQYSMELSKMLEYCSPDFSDGSGEVNYRTLKVVADSMEILQKSSDWEAVNEAAAIVFTGKPPSEESRVEARKIKDTPAAAEKISDVRKEFAAVRKYAQQSIPKVKFAGCTINGNLAKVEFEGIRNFDTAHLKKSRGKWLIVKVEYSDWKRKAAEKKLADERAADEKLITAAAVGHRRAVLTLDLKKMLTFCTDDYREAAGGTVRKKTELLAMADALDKMENSDDLMTVIQSALFLQGRNFTDIQREKFQEKRDSAEAREFLIRNRTNIRELRKRGAAAAETVQVTKIVFKDKNNAQSDVIVTDLVSRKRFEFRCFLVRRNKQWLISSVESLKKPMEK